MPQIKCIRPCCLCRALLPLADWLSHLQPGSTYIRLQEMRQVDPAGRPAHLRHLLAVRKR
jgi:hypothetical protein